jgi:hypothetical protein
METAIKGFERIVQTLGFQNFADYEVLRVTLTRNFSPTLEIIVLTNRSPQKRDADPSGPDHYIVRLLFRDVEDVELEDFNHQNVIQYLAQTKVDDRWKIHFAGIFGMDCSFTCDEGEVLSIEPTQMELSQIQVAPPI